METLTKKTYNRPEIDKIKIDNEISLIMMSGIGPGENPDETSINPDNFSFNPFKIIKF